MNLLRATVTAACCVWIANGCSLLTGVACPTHGRPADQTGRATITQGITGNVWFSEGDFMPTANVCGSSGTITPVVRTILVYQPPVPRGAYTILVDSLPAVPLDSVRSDATGFFELTLPAGFYSIVVREGSQLYVNVPTLGAGFVGAIEVKAAAVTKVPVDINYKATY